MAVAGGGADVWVRDFRHPFLRRRRFILSKFSVAVSDLESGISSKRVEAAKEIRNILNCHLDWISSSKLAKAVSLLKNLLFKKVESEVYENVLWTFCNLSCENDSLTHLIKKDEVNFFKRISEFVFGNFSLPVKDQAIWTLSNFAADCDVCRLEVRETRVLMEICQMLKETGNDAKRKSLFIWAIRNYVRPLKINVLPLFQNPEEFHFFIDTIVDELRLQTSNEIIIEGLNAFLGVLDSDPSLIQMMGMENKILDLLVKFLEYPDEISSVSVKIIGELSAGPDIIVQNFLDRELIEICLRRIPFFGNEVKKYIFWAFSNMISTFDKRITLIFRNNETFMNLILNHCYDLEQEIQVEAIICLMNILTALDEEDYHELLLNFVGRLFTDLLKSPMNETEKLTKIVYLISLHILEKLKHGDKSILKAALELDWVEVFLHRLHNTIPLITPNINDVSSKITFVCQEIVNYIRYISIFYQDLHSGKSNPTL